VTSPAVRASEALGRALATGDTTELDGIYADDVVVWHNNDRVEMTKAASMASIGGLSSIADDVSMDDVRIDEITGGFVQRFVLRGIVRATGNPIELHNCIVVQLDGDGRVTRMEEYVDPNGATQFAR
jgi:ketosteroid isomerase-like protein